MSIPDSKESALTEECRAEFTPGPWEVHFDTIYGGDGYLIADVTAHYPENQPTQDANARLIAAAPAMHEELKAQRAINAELLEALKVARDYVHAELLDRQAALAGWPEKWRIEEADLATVDAAIAKAQA